MYFPFVIFEFLGDQICLLIYIQTGFCVLGATQEVLVLLRGVLLECSCGTSMVLLGCS